MKNTGTSMQKENDYWLNVTNYTDYKARFFDDPTISTDETVKAITGFMQKPDSILEIGCGYGRLTAPVKNKFPKARVAGIDINPDIIAQAEGSGIDYAVGDKIKGKWDAIYAVTVFQHLPDDKKRDYILQAGKALNPGGVFIVQFIEGERDNFVDHWVTIDKMISWFQEAGLGVIQNKKLVHNEWTWLVGMK